MLTKAKTCALVGLEGRIVEVEVDISAGLPAFTRAVQPAVAAFRRFHQSKKTGPLICK